MTYIAYLHSSVRARDDVDVFPGSPSSLVVVVVLGVVVMVGAWCEGGRHHIRREQVAAGSGRLHS